MKYILFLFLFTTALGCQEKNLTVATISGKVSPEVKKVSLMQRQGMTAILQQVEVDSLGNFTLEYAGERPSHLTLSCGESYPDVDLYAKRGDLIELDLSGDILEIEGDNQEINYFLQKFKKKYIEVQQKRPSMEDEMLYKQSLENGRQELLELLQQEKGLDAEFVKLHAAWIQMDMLMSLVNLPYYRHLFKIGGKTISADYWTFLEEDKFDSPYYSNISFSVDVVREMLAAQEQYLAVSQGDSLHSYLKTRASRIADPVLREDYIIKALQIEMHAFNQYLPKVISSIEEMISSEAGKKMVVYCKETHATQCTEFSKLLAGQTAPEISGENPKGKRLSLKELKGNVVVIDVWGTHCIPCIAEIPHLHKLEEIYKGKPVKFVSIAMDSDKKQWIKFMEKKGMSGIQLIDVDAFKGDFRKRYEIKSIPRFIVIDQEGKIVDAFAPRPSSERLKMMIDGLL